MTKRIEIGEVSDDLHEVELALRNGSMASELNSRVAELIAKAIRHNFNASKSPDGQKWKPRKNVGDGHPLLMDTGALMQSSIGGGVGHIRKVTPRSIEMGSDGVNSSGGIRAAAIHNRGGAKMPQREFMGMSEKFLKEMDELIADIGERLID